MSVCPIDGCGLTIPEHRQMCWRHWEAAGPALQKTLLLLWNHGKTRDGFSEARASAIAQVSDLERLEARCAP